MGSINTSGRVIDKYRYFPLHENSEKIWETLKNFERKRKDFEINFSNDLKDTGKTKKNCGQFFDEFWKYSRKHYRKFEKIFEIFE